MLSKFSEFRQNSAVQIAAWFICLALFFLFPPSIDLAYVLYAFAIVNLKMAFIPDLVDLDGLPAAQEFEEEKRLRKLAVSGSLLFCSGAVYLCTAVF